MVDFKRIPKKADLNAVPTWVQYQQMQILTGYFGGYTPGTDEFETRMERANDEYAVKYGSKEADFDIADKVMVYDTQAGRFIKDGRVMDTGPDGSIKVRY